MGVPENRMNRSGEEKEQGKAERNGVGKREEQGKKSGGREKTKGGGGGTNTERKR